MGKDSVNLSHKTVLFLIWNRTNLGSNPACRNKIAPCASVELQPQKSRQELSFAWPNSCINHSSLLFVHNVPALMEL